MAAESLSFRRSEHALEAPFKSARASWQRRAVLDVRFGSTEGTAGHGEAAPLPGFSPDDLASCQTALGSLAPSQLAAIAASRTFASVVECVALAIGSTTPSARFALETAALDRLGQILRCPLWKLLGGEKLAHEAPRPLTLCAVLPSDDPPSAVARAKQLISCGVSAFKLKVGPVVLQPLQEATLGALRRELGNSVELRVDANRSLDPASLSVSLDRLAQYAPAFVEEPSAEPTPAAFANLSCGFALDESLLDAPAQTIVEFLALPSCRALVLKPTLLGGFGRCLELAALARHSGRAVIVSHTLEGPVGFAACVHLALSLGPGPAAGLWPLSHQRAAAWIDEGCFRTLSAAGLGVVP